MKFNATTAAAAAGLALSATAMAQNTGAVLNDGNARYQLGSSTLGTGTLNTSATTTGGGPTIDFRHTGQGTGTWGHDHIFSDWWWYRTSGDAREFAIASATSRTTFGTNGIEYGYNLSGGLTGRLTITVTDMGSNAARVDRSWVISNPGTADMSLSMFHFIDLFLNNQDANDVANLTNPNDRMLVTDSANAAVSLDWWGVGAAAASAGGFSTVRGQFTDADIDNLNNTTFPAGPADIGGAFQWNLVVPAGGSVSLMSSTGLNTPAIPAPGALALVGLGGLIGGRRRR
ncbi:hypothetical protein PHYC_01779 [Phycisphaerales bacterium]|nr:hypothetical protein PHYC_01779 [Phycisphaerales bacterium]